MAQTTETLLVQIGADIKDLKDGLKKSDAGIKKFTQGVGKLGGVLAGVFAASKVKDFAVELSALAGKAEGIEAAFARIGGGKILNELREATKGTVGDLELMQRAVQAKNFDIPLKDLASLFKFATKRAQETGESVDFLTNSIVLGIGRKSPLILDNLGISAIRLRKELKGAGTEAATVGDVAAAVGKIATTEMAKSGDIIETTAVKTAQWGATIDNLKVKVGKELNRALNALAPTVDRLLKGMFTGFTKVKTVMVDVINFFIELYNQSVAFRGAIQLAIAPFKNLWTVTKFVFNRIIGGLKDIGAIIKATLTGDFKAIPNLIKEAFKNTGEDFVKLGKGIAGTYVDAWKNTFSPQKKIELIGVNAEEKAVINSNYSEAGSVAAKAFTGALERLKTSLDISESLNVLGDSEEMMLNNEIMNEINQELVDMGLNAQYATSQFSEGMKKTQPVLEALKEGAESFGFALGEMAVSGEKSIKRLIQQLINMAQAIFLAKSASLGLPGLIAGLAGFGVIKGLASQIGSGGETFIEGDKLRVVQENAANNNQRRF